MQCCRHDQYIGLEEKETRHIIIIVNGWCTLGEKVRHSKSKYFFFLLLISWANHQRYIPVYIINSQFSWISSPSPFCGVLWIMSLYYSFLFVFLMITYKMLSLQYFTSRKHLKFIHTQPIED